MTIRAADRTTGCVHRCLWETHTFCEGFLEAEPVLTLGRTGRMRRWSTRLADPKLLAGRLDGGHVDRVEVHARRRQQGQIGQLAHPPG